MRKKQQEGSPINVEFEGKIYSGTYFVSSGVVTVNSLYCGPVSRISVGSRAEFEARRILRDILEGAKLRGELN